MFKQDTGVLNNKSDQRLEQAVAWCSDTLAVTNLEVTPASADASFRRYFRVRHHHKSYILMDAPPQQEDCGPFLRCAQIFTESGVAVPKIFAEDVKNGFILLEDFGDRLYLQYLSAENAAGMYERAISELIRIQDAPASEFPNYDRNLLMNEMALFETWYLGKHLNLDLTLEENELLHQSFTVLAEHALDQPQVVVHRDFHSRNLVWRPDQPPGVLDFQDAVWGPITYDLVSLLKDCYIAWPKKFIYQMVDEYLTQYSSKIGAPELPLQQFRDWFHLMGIQRHLKAIGIFARLNHRDGKPGYLNDIPRVMAYVLDATASYRPLFELRSFILEQVIPADPSLHRLLERNE
ncbi:MAG TPA: aminoglycoside phosphotransferase [Gammaproteobacteria bacterium]|nr:aminoglycoside phosphotransferase [Gammaproteobacteria bacterium]